MAAADPQGDGSTVAIDRSVLDASRRRANLPVAGEGDPWSVCAAPTNVLVVDPDGRVRGCEYAARAVGRDPAVPLAEAYQGEELTALRGALAAGRLPLSHCSGCAAWLQDELPAPPLRDYGTLRPAPERVAPRQLVLRLPAGDAPLAAGVADGLRAWWSQLGILCLETDGLDGKALGELLAALPADEPKPQVVLRLRRLGAIAAARRCLQGLGVARIELTLASRDDLELAAARGLADAIGAVLSARFVFAPDTWYEFEEVARSCAAHGIPLALCVLDHDGAVPLGNLDVTNLLFVKNVVASAWPRCGTATRPQSLGERAFDELLAELRKLLRRQAEAAMGSPTSCPAAVLRLPKPDHPWTTDPERRPWWLANLFGHGHLPAVREWLLRVVADRGGDGFVRREAWLRVLCQRLAADQQVPQLLELLRRVYADPKGRGRLVEADAAFAATLDLQRYGGPWGKRLGLVLDAPRKRPFPIGKPKQPKAKAGPADVTVLIPSYRHAEYIEETLRSVLAQRYANFKVLVVDDGSPDDTVARARSVEDPRIEVRQNAANVGLGNSVLQALATIDTPLVALLNSDDLFHPDRLARCRDVLVENPEVQLVTTGLSLVDSKGGTLTPANASLVLDGKLVYDWVQWFERVTPPADLPPDQLFATLLERNFLATSSNLVCRTEWLRQQAEALQSLKYCLDWQLFLQAALEGALHHVHEPLVAYRLHATNTVWFREGRRWSYYLEVNRVAAEALRRFAKRSQGLGEAAVERLLEAIAAHLQANRETDGFALFLNTAFGALHVDQLAASSPRVQELVEQLNTFAEQVRRARDLAEVHELDVRPAGQDHTRLLRDLAVEQCNVERDGRRWLQGYADSLEARLKDCWSGREKLEQAAQALRAHEGELDRKVLELGAELGRQIDSVQALQRVEQQLRGEKATADQAAAAASKDVASLRGDLERLRGELGAVRDLRALVDGELATARAERDVLRQELDAVAREREGLFRQAQELVATITHERDLLSSEQARSDDLRNSRDTIAAELTAELTKVRAELAQLRVDRDLVERSRDEIEAEHEVLQRDRADLQQERDDLRGERDTLQAEARRLDEVVRELTRRGEGLAAALAREQAETRSAALLGDELATALARERGEAARLREARERLDEELGAMRTELRDLQQRRDELARDRQSLDEALARERTQAKVLGEAKEALDKRRIELRQEAAQLRQELETLRASREFRAGNFLWNKMPLGYMSRRGKKWYRRLLDAKSRCVMWGSSLFGRRRKADGTAIVTACWQWPIYSHTFVYQEMIGLTHMGLDVQLFHWDLGDTGQLHKAFGYLADHRTQLQPIWENHKKDKEHFERTKPGRLRAFLELVAARTGRKVEDLENESLVLQGCTFARMAELAGARYLHSYFFYDQSFMAMQAAWLLGIPRGVSCYADHMLDDYPFKLVPLHVELCSVIVATSARIKRELSAMTDGKFDDKIIVKPNGVDGARFPPVQRQDRKPGDPFEVISISRIEPKKGLTHLVEAVADLKKRGHKVVAHIVGSKDPHSKGSLEYAAEFEQRIADLGVKDEVILHGMKRQEELPPILQRCRAFVAPYVEMGSGDKDGIPTAMLEGLASGLPVVTTDSGSILEVVTTEVEGIVVPQRDSKAFANALGRLIEDPALERRMAKAARARFDREFDIRVTEKRLHERVAKLVATKPKGPRGAK